MLFRSICIFTKKRRRIPGVTAIISAVFTLAGVGFLTLNGGFSKFGFGEFLGISSGLLYAAGIIIIDRMTKIDDALLIGIIQLGVMGALSMISSFIFESPRLPSSGTEWFIILVLAVVCSSFGFAFQTYAQKFVSSKRTGIFVTLNPLGAAIFGALILHEIFGIAGTAGNLFIMTGIVIHSRARK